MGFRVTWIARSGRSADELIAISQRVPSNERVEHPRTGYYLLEPPSSAWVVLIAFGTEFLEDLDAERARALSEDGSETLRFACSDTVMATKLECFRGGSKTWSIEYDCEDETLPVLSGDVPAFAEEIMDRLAQEQKTDPEVDHVYELTTEVGRELVGFRHDEIPGPEGSKPFRVLVFESELDGKGSRNAAPTSRRGPIDELLRQLILKNSLSGMPVKKEASRLLIGSAEFGVEVDEEEGGWGFGSLRITFLRQGKRSIPGFRCHAPFKGRRPGSTVPCTVRN